MTSSLARSAMTWGGNTLTTAVAIAIIALCALSVLPAEQQPPPAPGRVGLAAQDFIEIQQLVRKYAWALDGGDNYGYAYADLFTPDAVFVGMNQGPNGRSYQGRDVLAGLARTPAGGPTNQRHFTMNHVITPAQRVRRGACTSSCSTSASPVSRTPSITAAITTTCTRRRTSAGGSRNGRTGNRRWMYGHSSVRLEPDQCSVRL